MRYLTLITFIIIYTLVTPARAEYQSGYNPNEEYNCRYSWGSEKFLHKNSDGETVPLNSSQDIRDEFLVISNLPLYYHYYSFLIFYIINAFFKLYFF